MTNRTIEENKNHETKDIKVQNNHIQYHQQETKNQKENPEQQHLANPSKILFKCSKIITYTAP